MSDATNRDRGEGGFVNDNRGAIMVASVAMAIFATGVVFSAIGIGETILHRERMSDASDAVAYAAGVYHARGMNMIGSINIIMAAIMMLFLVLKLLATLLYLTAALLWAASTWTWALGAVAETVQQAGDYVDNAADLYDNFTRKPALTGCSLAQSYVGWAAPWLGEAKAIGIAQSFPKSVVATAAVSDSLIPARTANGSWRFGLPITSDSMSTLCERGGRGIMDFLMMPLRKLGLDQGPARAFFNIARSIFSGAVKAYVSYFCATDGGGDGESGGESTEAMTTDLTGAAWQKSQEICSNKQLAGGHFVACADETQTTVVCGSPAQATACKNHGGEAEDNGCGGSMRGFKTGKCEGKYGSATSRGITDGVARTTHSSSSGGSGGGSPSSSSMSPKMLVPGVNFGQAGKTYAFMIYGFAVRRQDWGRSYERGAGLAAVKTAQLGNLLRDPVGAAGIDFKCTKIYAALPGTYSANSQEYLWDINWRTQVVRCPLPKFEAGEGVAGILQTVLSKYNQGQSALSELTHISDTVRNAKQNVTNEIRGYRDDIVYTASGRRLRDTVVGEAERVKSTALALPGQVANGAIGQAEQAATRAGYGAGQAAAERMIGRRGTKYENVNEYVCEGCLVH